MSKLSTAGLIASVSGAVLVVALLLDWWDYPTAFENPRDLPEAAAFSAEAVAKSGQPSEADAFEFFDFRDIVWLAAGVLTFAFGLFVLVTGRAQRAIAAVVAALAAAAAVLIALTLISPPEYGDFGPEEARFDFGIDLPLDPELSVFVALVAALGCIAGAAVAMTSRTTERN